MAGILFAAFQPDSLVLDCFSKDGFTTNVKKTISDSEKFLVECRPQIVIFNLSGKCSAIKDELAFISRIREIDKTLPVLVLSDKKSSQETEIDCLCSGADAYLRLPVLGQVLLAWVHSILSRLENSPFAQERYSFDDIEVDVFKRTVKKKGWTLVMSSTEFELLVHFCRNNGRTVSRTEILKEVWQYSTCPTTRTVDNFICKLRRKLEDGDVKYLKTIKGTGYLFNTTGV